MPRSKRELPGISFLLGSARRGATTWAHRGPGCIACSSHVSRQRPDFPNWILFGHPLAHPSGRPRHRMRSRRDQMAYGRPAEGRCPRCRSNDHRDTGCRSPDVARVPPKSPESSRPAIGLCTSLWGFQRSGSRGTAPPTALRRATGHGVHDASVAGAAYQMTTPGNMVLQILCVRPGVRGSSAGAPPVRKRPLLSHLQPLGIPTVRVEGQTAAGMATGSELDRGRGDLGVCSMRRGRAGVAPSRASTKRLPPWRQTVRLTGKRPAGSAECGLQTEPGQHGEAACRGQSHPTLTSARLQRRSALLSHLLAPP